MPFSAKPTGLSMATIYNGSNPAIAYANDVLATNPIAYFPLNEGSGSNLLNQTYTGDTRDSALDGSYTGVTWNHGVKFLTDPVPFFDGANDYGDVYSAGFASAFDMDEGCILIWVKANAASFWTNGLQHTFARFQRDADNQLFVAKTTTNNEIRLLHEAAANTVIIDIVITPPSDWFSLLLSWSQSNDELKLYLNGSQIGSTATGLLASTGTGLNPNISLLGAIGKAPTSVHHGYLSQTIVWDSPVDASKLALATV